MINEVYNTTLSVLNKNNYGYLSPADFNLFATQAQLSLFEDFFYDYNNQINKENIRQSGTGYADIKAGIEQDISIFAVTQILDQAPTAINLSNLYHLPLDYYFINKLYYYPKLLFSGVTSAAAGNKLIDTTLSPFTPIAAGMIESPPVGSIVVNTSPAGAPSAPLLTAYVNAVDSISELSISADIMGAGQNYNIYDATDIVEVEKVSQHKIFSLTSSNLTAPTKTYPAYVLSEGSPSEVATVYPSTIKGKGDITCQYIRYPKTPKWTYVMVNNAPQFNASANDYQDFEIPPDNKVDLIAKILQYSGVSIREVEVYKFGANEEQMDNQKES